MAENFGPYRGKPIVARKKQLQEEMQTQLQAAQRQTKTREKFKFASLAILMQPRAIVAGVFTGPPSINFPPGSYGDINIENDFINTPVSINEGPGAPGEGGGGELAPPEVTTYPWILGDAEVGGTLTVYPGVWDGNPAPTFTYLWNRGGANIPGATATTYLVVPADTGYMIGCAVTATNSQGSATSGPSPVLIGVAPTGPTNTGLPVISGTVTIGSVLTTTPGIWTGDPAPTITYQWQRGGANITGATAANYTLVTADGGAIINVLVTATNAGGAVSAPAAGVGPVPAAAGPALPTGTVLDFTTGTLPTGAAAAGGVNGTCFNSSGNLVAASAPRFDYNPALLARTGGLPGVMVEEGRTNLVYPSIPNLADRWYAISGTTATINAAMGPDGTMSATEVVMPDGKVSDAMLYHVPPSPLPASTSFAAWVKGPVGKGIYLSFDNGARTNKLLHLFSGNWERTETLNQTLADNQFINFTTSQTLNGGVDLNTGLPAVTWYISHVDVQNGYLMTSTIPTTTAPVTRTADTVVLTGAALTIAQQATGSVVLDLVRRPWHGASCVLYSSNTIGSWNLGDCQLGPNVMAGRFGVANFGDAGTGLGQGPLQRVGGSWEAGAHAVCVDGYTVGTSTDAVALVSPTGMGLGCVPGGTTEVLNGWLLKAEMFGTKLTNAQLQAKCVLPAPVNLGSTAPFGATRLGYTNKIIDINPTVADIAPGRTSKTHAFFDSIFYDSRPPDKTVYYDTPIGLAQPTSKQILSQDRDSQHGALQYMNGGCGFYAEFDVSQSENHPDHFAAVWVMPKEHDTAQSDAYGGGDPPGYERWMELDVDEGMFGPSTTSSVIDWQGKWDNATQAYWRDPPTNTVPGNVTVNRIAKGWHDRTKMNTYGASFDPKHNEVRWYFNNAEIFRAKGPDMQIANRQNFYVIAGTQVGPGNIPYTTYTKRIRAYTVPRNLGYGDSLMFGTGASNLGLSWMNQLAIQLNRGVINRGVGGQTMDWISDQVVEYSYETTAQDIVFIDGGYNNGPWTNHGFVEAAYDRAVAALPAGTRYIIMGMPTAERSDLYTGTGSARADFDTINTYLATTFGTRFFNTDATLKAASTHTGQDATDDGHDIVPASQRADTVHWNDAGQVTIQNGIYAKLTTLGWI